MRSPPPREPPVPRAARKNDVTYPPRLPLAVTSGRWGQGRGRHFGVAGLGAERGTAGGGGPRGGGSECGLRVGRPPWPGSSTPRTGGAGTGGGWAGPRRCRCCRGSATGPSWCATRAPSPETSCSRCLRAPASRTTSSTAWGRREAGGPAARALGPRVSDPQGWRCPSAAAGPAERRVPGAPLSSRAALRVALLFVEELRLVLQPAPASLLNVRWDRAQPGAVTRLQLCAFFCFLHKAVNVNGKVWMRCVSWAWRWICGRVT